MFGAQSYAGKIVTPGTALQVAGVWASLKILGESVGSLPGKVFERTPNGKKDALGHPVYRLIHDEPNPNMGSVEFFLSQTASAALWGNAYSRVVRNAKGEPIALWPIPSPLMRIKRTNVGDIYYEYAKPSGGTEIYQENEILHLRTMSLDGINGMSPITQVSNPIGLAMALEEYAGRFFSAGGVPGVVLSHPGQLGEEARASIRESWDSLFGGSGNSHGIAVTEEGMTVTVVGAKPGEAQSLESRRFQLEEIARIYRIPPHMLADLERSTNNNIEHQGIEFVALTLLPWLRLWEQAIQRTLFTPSERRKYFVEFEVDALQRGDIGTRYQAYAIGRQWGWLSINDVRRLENMNSIGPDGDEYLNPMNMIAAGSDPAKMLEPPKKPEKPARPQLVAAGGRA